MSEINCVILNENDSRDLTEGFFVSDYNQIIKWDDTFSDINNLDSIDFELDEYNSKFITFNSPVIIGNLIINDFKIRYPDLRFNRDDVPIDSVWFNVKVIDGNAGENYLLLKESLAKILGEPSPVYDMTSHWTKKGINICLSTSGSDIASIRIENNRDYSNLIQNIKLISPLNEKILFRKKGFFIENIDFRKNKNLYKTPDQIKAYFTNDINSVIWATDKREQFGFSNKDYSIVFNMKDINEIKLQNELPGRGGGSTFIFINPLDSANLINVHVRTELYLFDNYVDELKSLFGEIFEILEPRYNA